MDTHLQEYTGNIIKIDWDHGFGFVYSDNDKNNYYFKIASLNSEMQLHDNVVFLVNHLNGNSSAQAIRKIYQNKVGINFIPRVSKTHLHKGIEPYLSGVIDQILDLNSERIEKDFPFPSIIGQTTCVSTDENDKVFYAIRKGRLGYTRFVLNREPEDTSFLTIILRRLSDYYHIITCYLGKLAKPEPWDKYALPDALEFWENHALIFGEEEIIMESKTDTCPWVLNQPAICRVKLCLNDPDRLKQKL